MIGESELYARQMERCQTLGIQDSRREFCQARFRERNKRGMDIVEASLDRLKELREDFRNNYSNKRLTPTQVKEWKGTMYGLIVDLDMKVSDIKQVQDSVDQFSDVMINKGPADVLNVMEEKVKELRRVRGEPGRGATTNIAIWKALAIAAFIGVTLWAIFKCSFFGCSIAENTAYGVVDLILFLVALFCWSAHIRDHSVSVIPTSQRARNQQSKRLVSNRLGAAPSERDRLVAGVTVHFDDEIAPAFDRVPRGLGGIGLNDDSAGLGDHSPSLRVKILAGQSVIPSCPACAYPDKGRCFRRRVPGLLPG